MTGAAEVTAESPARVPGQQPARTRVDADELDTSFALNDAHQPVPERTMGTGHTALEQTGAEGQHQTSTGDALEVMFAQRPAAAGPARPAAGKMGTGTTGPGVEVATATQTGHVVVRSWPAAKSALNPGTTLGGRAEAGATVGRAGGAGMAPVVPATGMAQRAVFDAGAGTLTLTAGADGRAEVDQGGTQLRAGSIVLHQGTGDGEASGGVLATSAAEGEAPATHVMAERATLLHVAGISRFSGTDAQPARLWQGGSQVQAASLVMDGRQHTLTARPAGPGGAVHAVFAQARRGGVAVGARPESAGGPKRQSRAMAPSGTEASRDSVLVTAARMDYNDAEHEATFGGHLRLEGAQGEVTGDHGAAFLEPAAQAAAGAQSGGRGAGKDAAAGPGRGPREESSEALGGLGGRLERLVVLGDVRLEQPGRSGSGSELTYVAGSNSFILTGTPTEPPRIRDAQQGMVTGATLLFGAADSSIVVAGAQASGKAPGRVHTETDLKH